MPDAEATNVHTEEAQVTLRSSSGGLAVTAVGLVCLIVLAIGAIVLNGLNAVTGLIGIAAIVATVVMLGDVPIRTSFDRSGVERSTPIRRHRIEWHEIDSLERMRRGGIRRPGSPKTTGIVVLRGVRRTILVDRTETPSEHARLRHVLDGITSKDLLVALVAPRSAETADEPEIMRDVEPNEGPGG